MSSEQLFQVGDVVSCPRWCKEGESGVVVSVDSECIYPIMVQFKDEFPLYTADGRYSGGLPPTLQHGPMNWSPNQVRPTPPFPARCTPIWVSDDKDIWVLRLAHSYDPTNRLPVNVLTGISSCGSYSHRLKYAYWLPFDDIKISDQE